MANISVGTYTLLQNPDSMPLIKSWRDISWVKTYGGVQVIDWGLVTVGQEVEIGWEYLAIAEFEALETRYLAGAVVAFDPGELTTGATTYNVKIIGLSGTYSMEETAALYANVTLRLLIMSVV